MSSPAAGRILLELLSRGPAARSELARRLGLSTPTLTRLTKPLLAQGLVREIVDPPRSSRTGRPSRPLAVVATAARFAGVKISRDRLDAVVIDLGGTVLRHEQAGLADSDMAAVATATGRLLDRLASADGITSAGVAVGGRVVDERLVTSVAGFAWDDLDLGRSLQAVAPVPTRLLNDVHAYLLAEQWLGSGRGSTALVLLTVGVGVGCAYAVDGRVQTGARSTAGLVGHWPLTESGPACVLGHSGCSGGWLPVDQVLARVRDVVGRTVDLDETVALAADDEATAGVLRDAATQVGRLAGLVANVVGAERVVLGGDAIGYVRFAEDAMRAGYAAVRHPLAGTAAELIVDPEAGFADWARGAAVAALAEWVAAVAG